MLFKNYTTYILITVFFVCTSNVRAEEIRANEYENGYIQSGYLNRDKNKILVATNHKSNDKSTVRFTKAWCEGDKSLQNISFSHFQPSQPAKTNHRQIDSNFDFDEGDLYKISPQKNAKFCFLFNSDFLKVKKLLPGFNLTQAPMPKLLLKQISTIKVRSIQQSWMLAKLSNGALYGSVLFKPIGNQELASDVISSNGELYFEDFPTVRKNKGEDLWGLDDGGVFEPRFGGLLFSYNTTKGIVIAIIGYGAEGVNLEIKEYGHFPPKKIYSNYFYTLN